MHWNEKERRLFRQKREKGEDEKAEEGWKRVKIFALFIIKGRRRSLVSPLLFFFVSINWNHCMFSCYVRVRNQEPWQMNQSPPPSLKDKHALFLLKKLFFFCSKMMFFWGLILPLQIFFLFLVFVRFEIRLFEIVVKIFFKWFSLFFILT